MGRLWIERPASTAIVIAALSIRHKRLVVFVYTREVNAGMVPRIS